MSTTFAIFKNPPESDGHGGIKNFERYDEDKHYKVVAYRSNGIQWINGIDLISNTLKDSTEVYALDNTPQGIFTVGDIKKAIKDGK